MNAIEDNQLIFANLLGSSVTAITRGIMLAHFTTNFGDIPDPIQPNDPASAFSFEWAIRSDRSPFTKEQLIEQFTNRRMSSWQNQLDTAKDGWTQWDSLEVETWEETNRGRLADALKPFNLKIEWKDLTESQSSWFRIVKA